jgi:hypothetical protein
MINVDLKGLPKDYRNTTDQLINGALPDISPCDKRYFHGRNFVLFLRKCKFIGQLTQGDNPIIGLLVAIDTALDECKLWSNQEITRSEFMDYLNKNRIFIGDINKFQEAKTNKSIQNMIEQQKEAKVRLQKIADSVEVSGNRLKIEDGQSMLTGRNGYINSDWKVYVEARSKRHFSGVKRRLDFMKMLNDHGTGGEFAIDHPPTASEAETLRAVLGMKKRPTVAPESKVIASNPKKGDTLSENSPLTA